MHISMGERVGAHRMKGLSGATPFSLLFSQCIQLHFELSESNTSRMKMLTNAFHQYQTSSATIQGIYPVWWLMTSDIDEKNYIW